MAVENPSSTTNSKKYASVTGTCAVMTVRSSVRDSVALLPHATLTCVCVPPVTP